MVKAINYKFPTSYFISNDEITSIPLTNSDKVCYIDKEDYLKVSDKKWYLNDNGYVACTSRKDNYVKMHRLLSKPKDNEIVHHINRNRLDNRKINLENMSISKHIKIHNTGTKRHQNIILKFRKSSFSKKGIFKMYHGFETLKGNSNKPFRVRIRYNGDRFNAGTYEDPISAQTVYDLIINEIHGVE